MVNMLQLLWVRVVLSVILAAFAYDIGRVDGFSKSQTYKCLKSVGIIGYGERFYKRTEKTWKHFSHWAKKNYPLLYDKAMSQVQPYLNLIYNITVILSNIAFEFMNSTIKIVSISVENSLILLLGDTFKVAKESIDIITVTLKNVSEAATYYANNLLG